MRSTPQQLALDNLRQAILTADYETRELEYEFLKASSGKDFGYDVDAWEQWIKEDDDRKLQAIREERESYGVVAVDGKIDTTSEAYKRYWDDFTKRIDETIDNAKQQKKDSSEEVE